VSAVEIVHDDDLWSVRTSAERAPQDGLAASPSFRQAGRSRARNSVGHGEFRPMEVAGTTATTAKRENDVRSHLDQSLPRRDPPLSFDPGAGIRLLPATRSARHRAQLRSTGSLRRASPRARLSVEAEDVRELWRSRDPQLNVVLEWRIRDVSEGTVGAVHVAPNRLRQLKDGPCWLASRG